MKITGYENEIWDEKKEIIEELKRAVQEKQKEKKTCILSFDLYPGVRKEEITELVPMRCSRTGFLISKTVPKTKKRC